MRGVESRTIQRMRHRADKLARGVARQLRVGVERDDVFHPRQKRDVADDERERVSRAAQECVQRRELAALALEAHPDPLLRIPRAWAMEQEERTVPDAVNGLSAESSEAPLGGSPCFSLSSSMLACASSSMDASSGRTSWSASRKSVNRPN